MNSLKLISLALGLAFTACGSGHSQSNSDILAVKETPKKGIEWQVARNCTVLKVDRKSIFS